MIAAIEKYIRDEGIFRHGDRVLIGISGGADSTALAYVLHYLSEGMGLQLHLAHLHHCIRGAEADEDMRFVHNLAAKLNLPVFTLRRDVPALAAADGVSVEMAARKARLEFFEDLCRRYSLALVALAHNSDDQAETVIMRIARGTGCSGLAGIAPIQQVGGITLVHPMLTVRHSRAVQFLQAHGLAWREDATNVEEDYLRNRVRHRLLPLMEEMLNPNLRDALCRTAKLLGDEDDFMNAIAAEGLKSCSTGEESGSSDLDVAKLSGHHKAIRRRIILGWLYRAGVDPQKIDMERVDAVDDICGDVTGSKSLDIGGGFKVLRRYSALTIEPSSTEDIELAPLLVTVPSETVIRSESLIVRTAFGRGIIDERGGAPGHFPASASLSRRKLRGRDLYLRHYRPGDRMRPYGMAGSRKLQDILTDCKVPADKRGDILVLEVEGRIAWLPGYRISGDWAVESSDAECLQISLARI